MIYGYARVSADGESLARQVRTLTRAGCAKVVRETVGVAEPELPRLHRLLAQLEPRDVVVVTRLHRLARSMRDLLGVLTEITERQAGFRSLGDSWADTTGQHGDLALQVLTGLVEFERDMIRTRTGEGRRLAVARGVKMGRKPKMTPNQIKEAIRRREGGEPMREIARSYGVSHSTISRLTG